MLIVTCYEQGAPSGAKYNDNAYANCYNNVVIIMPLLAELNTSTLIAILATIMFYNNAL